MTRAPNSILEQPAKAIDVDLGEKRLNRRILQAASTVTIATIVVKLIATFKEFVVAGVYGRSDVMDAFLVAFLIPNLLVNVIAESMNQVLIPSLVRERLQKGQRQAQQLLSNSMFLTSLLLGAACLAMALLARFLFPLIASGFSPAKIDLCLRMFWALLPTVLLTGVASNCTAVLNTAERFAWPALAPGLVPISIIAGSLLMHRQLGIWALVTFSFVGAAIHAGAMARALPSQGYRCSFAWSAGSAATTEVARQYGLVVLSSVLASGGLLVDQAMAASLPAGSVSTMVFAGRFAGVVVTLLAGAVSAAVAPYFSMMVARKDWHACRKTLRHWTRLTAAVAIPLAGAMILGAHLLVRVTLQHGVFSSRDTSAVAPVLAMYAIQIPFFAASRVYYRFVLAMGRTDLVLTCGLMNLILNIVLDLVLMRSMGVAGLALATSLWTVCTFVFFWYCAHWLLKSAEAGSQTAN